MSLVQLNDQHREIIMTTNAKEIIKKEETPLVSVNPMRLVELAISNNADLDKLERLMDLQERWEAKEARKMFYASLAKFQGDIPDIQKNGKSFHGLYSTLDDISKSINSSLTAQGLSYRFEQSLENNIISVTCIITHSAGHSERTEMSGIPDKSGNKNQIQQSASTFTYLKRYTLTGALGLTSTDPDTDCNQEPEKKEPKVLTYSGEDFQGQLARWGNAIKNGKTPDGILKFCDSRNIKLTKSQIEQIKGLGK